MELKRQYLTWNPVFTIEVFTRVIVKKNVLFALNQ